MEMVEIKEILSFKHHQRNRSATDNEKEKAVMDEIVKLENKIFPKHESLASSFYHELSNRNCCLLYALSPSPDGRKSSVAGYVMYSGASCLLASINKLAVREDCRRNGYGEALLKAAIHKCRSSGNGNAQRISLHVDPLRTPAVLLYQKLGFKALVKRFKQKWSCQNLTNGGILCWNQKLFGMSVQGSEGLCKSMVSLSNGRTYEKKMHLESGYYSEGLSIAASFRKHVMNLV